MHTHRRLHGQMIDRLQAREKERERYEPNNVFNVWRTVRSNHFHEINWFYFAGVAGDQCVCVSAIANYIADSTRLDGMWCAQRQRVANVAETETNGIFSIKKKGVLIEMHDKERKVEEYFHFLFFVGSFFFVGSRSKWNAVLCQKSNDNFMFYNFYFIQPFTTTMNMSWNEELITSPIDNMYWRSPNIYLKLNWTQFDNAVLRLSFVSIVHFNIRIHIIFFLIQITLWLNTDRLHSLWRSPHTKTMWNWQFKSIVSWIPIFYFFFSVFSVDHEVFLSSSLRAHEKASVGGKLKRKKKIALDCDCDSGRIIHMVSEALRNCREMKL